MFSLELSPTTASRLPPPIRVIRGAGSPQLHDQGTGTTSRYTEMEPRFISVFLKPCIACSRRIAGNLTPSMLWSLGHAFSALRDLQYGCDPPPQPTHAEFCVKYLATAVDRKGCNDQRGRAGNNGGCKLHPTGGRASNPD